jgi:hypothetical protein
VAAITCPAGQVHPKDWNGDVDNSSCCPGTGNPTAMVCLTNKYINPVVNLLAALVGVVVLARLSPVLFSILRPQVIPARLRLPKSVYSMPCSRLPDSFFCTHFCSGLYRVGYNAGI